MKLAILTLFTLFFAFHGGRTDSSGGHNSSSGYHYHNGGFSSRSSAARYTPPARTRPRYAPPSRSYDFDIRMDVNRMPRTEARTKPPSRLPPMEPPKPTSKWPDVAIDFKFHGIDEDGNCKVMLFINVLVDRTTLVNVARTFNYDTVRFYLPGMKHDAKPWAIAKKVRDDYICAIKRENLDSAQTFRIKGKVVNVYRGDAIVVQFDDQDFNVKLWGIHLPPNQKLAKKSRERLAKLCMGKTVSVFARKRNDKGEFIALVELQTTEQPSKCESDVNPFDPPTPEVHEISKLTEEEYVEEWDESEMKPQRKPTHSLNYKMVVSGYAAANSNADPKMKSLEAEAKEKRRGLWRR